MSDIAARVVTIIAASAVLVVLLLVVALAVARGESLSSPQVGTLLGLVAVLGAVVVGLFQNLMLQIGQSKLQASQEAMQGQMNGHLQAHVEQAKAAAAPTVDVVQQALSVLGPAGIAALVTQAVSAMTPEQLATLRGESAPASSTRTSSGESSGRPMAGA